MTSGKVEGLNECTLKDLKDQIRDRSSMIISIYVVTKSLK